MNSLGEISLKKNTSDPHTDPSVLNFVGKSFPSSTSTALPARLNCSSDSSAPIKTFVDLCIEKTLSFINSYHIDESPGRNADNNLSNQLTPEFARIVTSSHTDTPYPMSMLQNSQVPTKQNQLSKAIQKAQADSGDCRTDTKYVETLQRSRISNMSFKRKYKPLATKFREESEIFLEPKRSIDNGVDSEEQVYDEKVDQILKIMNSDKKYALAHVSADSVQSKLNAADMGKYSYYALFFMITSNFIGFGLSLTFQMLLFLKANADRFLHKSWLHWKSVGSLQFDNNMLTIILLIPVLILVCCAYGFIWACFGVNKFLLTTVPDRVAQMINFNVRIVTK